MLFACQVLLAVSPAILGLFAGAMLTEGFVLVAWWRTLSPSEFFVWYSANDRRLLGFFGPVTSITAVIVVAAAALALWTGHPGRWQAAVAAALMLTAVATFFVYFEAANARFSDASVAPEALGDELARWARWHGGRTVLGLLATAFAILAQLGDG